MDTNQVTTRSGTDLLAEWTARFRAESEALERIAPRSRMMQGRALRQPIPLGLCRKPDGAIAQDLAAWPLVEQIFDLAAAGGHTIAGLSRCMAERGVELTPRQLRGLVTQAGYTTGDFVLSYGTRYRVELDRPILEETYNLAATWIAQRAKRGRTARA